MACRILELMKNAMRCTVEHAEQNNLGARGGDDRHFATLMVKNPIVAVLASAEGWTTLKLSDRGGGIPVPLEDQIFEYGYTSVGTEDGGSGGAAKSGGADALGNLGAGGLSPHTVVATADPIAGLGFGLPLAQCYARYFGGGIRLVSLPGHGTDAYLRLNTSGAVIEQVALL
jgi:signal transduction histidine kinase